MSDRTGYSWDRVSRRYRSDATGRYVSERTITSWRNTARRALEDDATAITARLARGELTVQQWERLMKQIIKRSQTTEFLLGVGGRKVMTRLDRRTLDGLVEEQLTYLRGFSRDLASGRLSPERAAARARMYARSGNRAFNEGRQRSWGVDLPGMPATDCRGLTNCACRWSLKNETRGRGDNKRTFVIASWHLGAAEHCDVCLGHAADWAQLEFETTR